MDIVSKTKGVKFVTDVGGPGLGSSPNPSTLNLLPIVANFAATNAYTAAKGAWIGVGFKFVYGTDLKKNEVRPAIFQDFLPKALETGQFICAPEPEVVGHGLEQIQPGFELLK